MSKPDPTLTITGTLILAIGSVAFTKLLKHPDPGTRIELTTPTLLINQGGCRVQNEIPRVGKTGRSNHYPQGVQAMSEREEFEKLISQHLSGRMALAAGRTASGNYANPMINECWIGFQLGRKSIAEKCPVEAFDTALCSIEKCVEFLQQVQAKGGGDQSELIADMQTDHKRLQSFLSTITSVKEGKE